MAIRSSGPFAMEVFLNDNIAQEFNQDSEVRADLARIAEIAVQYAKNLAAVDTGNMRDSIKFAGFEQVGDELAAVVEVGEDAEYWVFVEYGTGRAGAGSPQPDPGILPGYTHGSSAGIIARPFMRPTLTYLRSRIGD